MTLMWAYILMQYRNALAYHLTHHAKCFVSGLHNRMDMAFIDIHQKFLSNGRCLKSSNCNKLKTVSRNLNFVNAVSILYEIAEIAVKMVCKMTFDDNYRFFTNFKIIFS